MDNVEPSPPPKDMRHLLPTLAREEPAFDREGVPWSEYVHKVEFVDANPPATEEAPVHVVKRVLFDGVMAPCMIHKDGITVDLSSHDGTVVTLNVHRDDVQVGSIEDDGTYTPWLIGGRRVLTPTGEGWEWTPVDPDDPDDPFICCSFFVAEVHVR